MLTVLSGGTGSRKLVEGLVKILPQREINVIVNTADDIEIFNLHISPDIDSIIYGILGIIDDERGWGIKGDTFNFHESISKIIPSFSWFKIGDRDLAIHIIRSYLLSTKMKLSEVTRFITSKLNIDCNIIPMTNDKVTTYIFDGVKKIHFQEFWVLFRGNVSIKAVIYENIDNANPSDEAIEAILNSKLIIIGPSNPITSIGPILSIKKIKELIKESNAIRISVSPILGSAPFSGPAGILMQALGLTVNPYEVAKMYRDLIDYYLIDESDYDPKKVEELKSYGIEVIPTNISLKTIDDRIRLAKFIIEKFYK